MTTNPYRKVVNVLRKIGNIILITLAILFVTLTMIIAPVAVAVQQGWGWWSLLAVLFFPLVLLVAAGFGMLTDRIGESIGRAWRRAERDWDARNRDRGL